MFSRRSRGADLIDDRLRALAERAPEAGIFCDFDGSLARIVPDPSTARPVPGAARALNDLARRFALVTVVSGRPVSFLASHLHAQGVRMVGLYGIEERIGREMRVLPGVRAAHDAVDRAITLLRERLGHLDGVYVEDKGMAVSVHFRRVPDPDAAMRDAFPTVAAVAEECDLGATTRGKLVLEIGPSIEVDKGSVVRRLIEQKGLRAAMVIGDDLGDIPMFRAADGLDVVVRVVVGTDELPPALAALADRIVESPDSLVRMLAALARLR